MNFQNLYDYKIIITIRADHMSFGDFSSNSQILRISMLIVIIWLWSRFRAGAASSLIKCPFIANCTIREIAITYLSLWCFSDIDFAALLFAVDRSGIL